MMKTKPEILWKEWSNGVPTLPEVKHLYSATTTPRQDRYRPYTHILTIYYFHPIRPGLRCLG